MNYESYDQLLNPVLCVGNKGEIKYFNHICTVFFKQSPRKLAKLGHISELITTDTINFDEIIKEVYSSKDTQVSPEISFRNDEIGEMTLILKFIPLGGEVFINILDFSIEKQLHEKYKQQVTELKETHEQILAADKLTALGEMIAGISHEVSTPLTIVNDRLMALKDSIAMKNFEQSQNIINEVDYEYNRVLRIISGMQSFVRNQEEDFIITDVNYMLSDVKGFFKGLNYPEGYKLNIENELNLWVMANPLKLQQVLINLVKNSFDAFRSAKMKEGQVDILLQTNNLQQSNTIIIRDNGPGIEKENQDKVFEMFFTTKSIGEGTGLGLSITKKILEAHNGMITLNETDKGCEFQIDLPIVEIGSFTQTNKYLQGETEIEGEKVLIYSQDLKLLNAIYEIYRDSKYVLIFSRDLSNLDELADFLLIDKVVLLESSEINFEAQEIIDLSTEKNEDILKKLKEHL